MARAQASAQPPAEAFLSAVAEQAGFVDAFVTYCANANRAGVANDAVQLQGWEQRNHWQEAKPRIAADPALQKGFADSLAAEKAQLAAHTFKSGLSCAVVGQELHSPAHDPSLSYKNVENALGGGNSTPTGDNVPRPAVQPPPGATAALPADAIKQPSRQSQPAESSANPSSNPDGITVGAMTVTPPPGWTVQKAAQRLGRTTNQDATQHGSHPAIRPADDRRSQVKSAEILFMRQR